MSETEMRDSEAITPQTQQELSEYIDGLVSRPHEYGTCVYAMSLAATAAFNFVAHKLGVTGFQASCADMDFIRRTRNISGPFMLLQISDTLYSATRLQERVSEAIRDSSKWLQEEARKKLKGGGYFHPDVFERLMELSKFDGDELIENRAKLCFLYNMGGYFPTELFVEKNIKQFKRFGFDSISLMEGSIEKYDSVKEGCSFRIGMPVSLDFSREVDGFKISFNVETERKDSNGSAKYNFNFDLLEQLIAKAKPAVAVELEKYLTKARKAQDA